MCANYQTSQERERMPSSTQLNLPQSPLAFNGINEDQRELLVAIYVGAFNRAPEYEGLQFWATQLSQRLANNEAQYDALKALGKSMYAAGATNGEGGTQTSTSEFVTLAYQNSLGRSAGSSEISYWAGRIDSGDIDRGVFIIHFLDEALKNSGDSQFLQARVRVAEFMAQEHVSGPGMRGLDEAVLRASIETVSDETSASAAISEILAGYGAAPDTALPREPFTSRQGEVDVHLLSPEDRGVTIVNFERNFDQFGMSDALKAKIGSIQYLGEPHSIEALHSGEYFTGVAGQAALLRNEQLLVIDLDGDGRYDSNLDISVNLPSVFQLEDWNFFSSNNEKGEPPRELHSTPGVEDVHTLTSTDRFLLIKNFDVYKDKFALSADLKAAIGSIGYTGEPTTLDVLQSPDYFSGKKGQAALLRDSKLLIVDLDGNGDYDSSVDITISLPGVFQLEDWNFIA